MGAFKETSHNNKSDQKDEGASNCEEQESSEQIESKPEGLGTRLKKQR